MKCASIVVKSRRIRLSTLSPAPEEACLGAVNALVLCCFWLLLFFLAAGGVFFLSLNQFIVIPSLVYINYTMSDDKQQTGRTWEARPGRAVCLAGCARGDRTLKKAKSGRRSTFSFPWYSSSGPQNATFGSHLFTASELFGYSLAMRPSFVPSAPTLSPFSIYSITTLYVDQRMHIRLF
jgi:hypothetical protein